VPSAPASPPDAPSKIFRTVVRVRGNDVGKHDTHPVIPANAGRGSIANSACAGPKGNNPETSLGLGLVYRAAPSVRMFFVSPPRASPFCQTPQKEPKRLAPTYGPDRVGLPSRIPPPRRPAPRVRPVAHGALATSMSHDLLSGGFARPSEGAFRCTRVFLWKSKSESQSERALAFRRSELAREPNHPSLGSRVRGNDEVGVRRSRMTPNSPPTPNGPLSLQGEGWGEGALEPSTYATGKPRSRASTLL